MTSALGRSALLALALVACGDPSPSVGGAVESPHRTAAQDAALRAMAMDVAASRACEVLDGRFVPLPEERSPNAAPPIGDGRLWIDRCDVTRRGDRLAIALGGRGWQWVERSRPGPLGSSFTARGAVRFQADASFEGVVDLRYDEGARRASAIITPAAPPRTRVDPIGAVPVEPDGGWSSLVGGLGALIGASPQDQARQTLEVEAAATLQRELGGGATIDLDLCTSQLDVRLGPRADGAEPAARPFPADGHRALENARSRARAGMPDLSGPWGGDGDTLIAELAIEGGGTLSARLVCADEARRIAADYLATGAFAEVAGSAVSGSGVTTLRAPRETCDAPYLLVTTPDEVVEYRVRVRREGADHEAIVDCE